MSNKIDLSRLPPFGVVYVTSDSWVSFEDLKTSLFEFPYSATNEVVSFALEHHKKLEEKYSLLFLNLNDESSQRLHQKILDEYVGSNNILYIVDAFEAPEVFGAFAVKQAPTLITSHVKFFVTDDYLPSIYSKLGL